MSEESDQNRQLIRKFMEQNLNKDEHALFKQKMQEEDFANRAAEESVRLSSRSKLQTELKAMHQDVIVSPSQWRKKFAVGVIFCLLACSALWYYSTQSTPAPSPEAAFAAYFEPYPNVFEQRNAQLTEPQQLQQALEAYDNKDYKKAIALFEPLIAEKTYDGSYLPFYYALSLLANNQGAEAVPHLQKILSGTSPVLKSESNWYLALAYIQLDQKEKAMNILQEIQSDSASYNTMKAQQFLELLKE